MTKVTALKALRGIVWGEDMDGTRIKQAHNSLGIAIPQIESEMSHSRIELQVERGKEYASAFPLVTDSLLGTSLLSRGNLDAHRLPSMLLAESVGAFLT